MKKGYTDITIVLDRSGSMANVKDDTIGGFNHFLAEHKKDGEDTRLSLVQFDDQYEVVHKGKRVTEVEPFCEHSYKPRGSTALLDAVGRTINETGNRLSDLPDSKKPEHVIFVVITDGQENASHEFTRSKIKDMVDHHTSKYNWVFSYLGANQDSFSEAGGLGFSAMATSNYTGDRLGTRKSWSRITQSTLGCARVGLNNLYATMAVDEKDISDIPAPTSKS